MADLFLSFENDFLKSLAFSNKIMANYFHSAESFLIKTDEKSNIIAQTKRSLTEAENNVV